MTHTFRPLRVVLALAAVALSAAVLSGVAGGPTLTMAAADDTALPAGWELCVLQGTSAPLTQDNITDLDGWQVQEGGSTNNTAAYNPFNTSRTTDVTGAPLPTVPSSGFPAFANWLAGCSATVATLLQPNMSTITASLRAGNVAPSAAFLALVDQSQWCAPSADGVPCYASAILGGASSLAGGVLTGSSALDVYGNVKTDLHEYQIATLAVATDKGSVATLSQQLATAQSEASSTRAKFDASQRALRSFAVDEYVNSGLYVSTSYANPSAGHKPFGPPTASGVVAQQYENVAASDVLARAAEAESALKASLARRDEAAKQLQQSVATLSTDTDTENRELIRLVADVATLQTAGACTQATVTVSAPNVTAPGSTTTTAPAGTPTTTPTTTGQSVATTTVPTSTTTTSTSTTTTSTLPIIKVPVTTTTVAPTTTTTSASTTTTSPSSSTTTTTSPGAAPANAPAPTPNPAGIQALQGCVAALASAGQ